MLRRMIWFTCVLSTLLSVSPIDAQEETIYVPYVVYTDDDNVQVAAPTVRWLNVGNGEIMTPSLEGTAQCPVGFSPDGETFVYSGGQDEWSSYLLDVETGQSRMFNPSYPLIFSASWSPNSELLTFYTQVAYHYTDVIYEARRGRILEIVGGPNVIGRGWASNTVFVYIAAYQTTLSLHYFDVYGSTDTLDQSVEFESQWFNYAVSPDLSHVIVNLSNDEVTQLHLYNWETEELSILGDPEAPNLYPSWSSDSQRVAYFTHGYPGTGMRVLDMQTGETQTLTELSDPDFLQQGIWSPDGTHMLVITYTPDDTVEYAVWDLATNESRDIVIDGIFSKFESEPRWVSNNELLFAASASADENSPNDIYRYNAETEEVNNITNSPEYELFHCSWG